MSRKSALKRGSQARPSTSQGDGAGALGAERHSLTVSRFELLAGGVPEDYVDTLLDTDYMERLIFATDKFNEKRQKQFQRHLCMHRLLLWTLLLLAILGIVIAVFKTYIQPSKDYVMSTNIPNVDMVLVIDTSWHMGAMKDLERKAIDNFTNEMDSSLWARRQNEGQKAHDHLAQLYKEEKGFLSNILPQKPQKISIHGGELRTATAMYNSEMGHKFLTELSTDFQNQSRAVAALKAEEYHSTARFMDASKACEQVLNDPSRSQFCIVVGDSLAACDEVNENKVEDVCDKFPDLCPPDYSNFGNMLEYSQELQKCGDFASAAYRNRSVNTVLLLTVNNKQAMDHRMSNEAFRTFVTKSTRCEFVMNTTTQHVGPYLETITEFGYEDCMGFGLASNEEDILALSRKIAQNLSASGDVASSQEQTDDARFLCFLLLAIPFLIYIGGSKLVQLWVAAEAKMKRAMGTAQTKKKMVKVKKLLVLKDENTGSGGLTEMEMAAVTAHQPLVGLNEPMTLRSRLKGAYVRTNAEKTGIDGKGIPVGTESSWAFEAADSSGEKVDQLQAGMKVHIRNGFGQVLTATEDGLQFLPGDGQKTASMIVAGAEATHPEAGNFLVVAENADNPSKEFFLGETIKIQCCATGKFLRVHKDGSVDTKGEEKDPASWLTIDRGGQVIQTGAVIRLHNAAVGQACEANADGTVQTSEKPGKFSYWKLDKKMADTTEAAGSSTDAAAPATGIDLNRTLKHGDIVTLTCLNNHNLEVRPDKTVACGGAEGAGSASSSSPPSNVVEESTATPAGVVREFVVERIGVTTAGKRDLFLRNGGEIALRPFFPEGDAASEAGTPSSAVVAEEGAEGAAGGAEGGAGGAEGAEGAAAPKHARYLRINESKGMDAEGSIMSMGMDHAFMFELANMQEIMAPLTKHIEEGDATLVLQEVWNKTGPHKRVKALQAAWVKPEDLKNFEGQVVTANDQGQYVLPKGAGVREQGWVAVVKDGVDIKKTAKQAKAQGAKGIIVRTKEVSIKRLAKDKKKKGDGSTEADEEPELPVIYVDAEAKELEEKGLVVKGVEVRGAQLTEAMRKIGDARRLQSAGTVSGTTAVSDVFAAIGSAMQEQAVLHPEIEAPEKKTEDSTRMVKDEAVDDPNFKWQVKSNTAYLWSAGGGGATQMKVDYGSAAPPSAQKKVQVDKDGNVRQRECDAGKDFAKKRNSVTPMQTVYEGGGVARRRSSVVGVKVIESKDFVEKQMGTELEEVLAESAEDFAGCAEEEWPEESDFKITYNFEEFEMDENQDPEEVESEELISADQGTAVDKLAVPKGMFYLVVILLLVSVVVTVALLLYMVWPEPIEASDDPDAWNPDAPPAPPHPVGFLSSLAGQQMRTAFI